MRDYLGKRALRMRLPLLVETELVCSTDFQFGVCSLVSLPGLGQSGEPRYHSVYLT